ncbi:lactococcin 972 family bacteriocin [Leifsonia sp. fls2-241-R2A-40a]|uniref:lactococcin 972 family bacteriocin n=1 Tax=Leifsonia sp. fls2-241-R2A-40a TaxID=3040290 RepID=UPI00330618E7
MKLRNAGFAALLAAALVAVPVSSASATTVNAGGGLWQYGSDSNVYSYYHHATKNHTATACNGGIVDRCRQVAAVKNQWARATQVRSLRGNTAYWNTL